MKTALITGANRGIGLETARQLGKLGYFIFLTARDKTSGEKALSQLGSGGMFVQLDVTDKESIANASSEVSRRTKTLDVLINNAGILLDTDESIIDFDDATIYNTFNANAFGILFVTWAFKKLLKTGSRIINVSSGGGSMTDDIEGWAPVYCVTKSTVNAITRHMAYELADKNIAVNAVCPGWVKTKMGGRGADRPVEKGAESIVWLASGAPQNLTGKFIRDKKVIPW